MGRGGGNLAKNGFRVVVDKWPLPKRAFGGYLVPSGEARFDSSLFIKLD